MRKSIRSLHKEKLYLEELTDEEVAEIQRSAPRYQTDEDFKQGIDAEIVYRMKKKLEK